MKPQSIILTGKKKNIGILLIHGFTGSTNEMQPMAEFLHQAGYSVCAPLLAGHGTSPELMNNTGWVDWFASAKEGYIQLRQTGCQHIVVVGLSMGGLLALKMAQHFPVIGIVTLCTPVIVRDKRMPMARYIQKMVPYIKRINKKEKHIENVIYPYDKTPLSCIVSLEKLLKNVSLILGKIRQPILVIQSDQDETVDPSSAQLLFERVGSGHKEMVRFEQSSHIITLDHEQEVLHEKVSAFIKHITQSYEQEETHIQLAQRQPKQLNH